MTNVPIKAPISHDIAHLPSAGRHIPTTTYRLQLGPELDFDAATAALDYLQDLGVSDVYCSPILQAAPGSTHGYDVVDPTRISAELGGREGFERFASAAHGRGMGVVVDVVPNHMGVPTPLYHNRALWSVLRYGPSSQHAKWFDGTGEGEGILMPFLGSRIGTALANGEITRRNLVVPGLEHEGPQPVLVHHDQVYPVRAGTENLPLDVCVAEQYYRLAYWKVAAEELNFRRFFDVDTLVAVRVEDPEVFDATHALLLELYEAGHIDGFRIDHPDGLANPRDYMRRLSTATKGAWIAAEKILEAEETLPDDWMVCGTTGYDATWRIGALLCDPNGYGELASVSHMVAGDIPGTLPEVVEQAKSEVMNSSLMAEVHRIASLAYEICSADIMLRDHTQGWIASCLGAMVVAIDRYRAYIVPGEPAPEKSTEVLETAAAKAKNMLDEDLHDTLEVVLDLVSGHDVGSGDHRLQPLRDELVIRFQQVCGAVQAKGLEDTAFYRWTHLVALNEVGGSPQTWGLSPDDFHHWCATMASNWPATMTAGSTHDTKRSEDVRARQLVISQYASEWREMITSLHLLAEDIEGHAENLLWQTIAGTWTDSGPIEVGRLVEYMIKVVREQKIWTSWTSPDLEAEDRMTTRIKALCANEDVMGTFADWYALTEDAARDTVLSMKAIQLTCVGVADNYQGTETLQNTLVDPDNRRPVDFRAIYRTVKDLAGRDPVTLAEEKLHLTRSIMRLRRRRPEAFVGKQATYCAVPTSSGHVVAYSRGEDARVIVVATRLPRPVLERDALVGASVVLPEGSWHDVVSGHDWNGGNIDLAELLAHFPCAVLEEISSAERTSSFRAITAPPHRQGLPSTNDGQGILGWLTRRLNRTEANDREGLEG